MPNGVCPRADQSPDSPQQRCGAIARPFTRRVAWAKCRKTFGRSMSDWKDHSYMGHVNYAVICSPFATPHVWCFRLSYTREGTSILINAGEAPTRRIRVHFGTLLMKVIRYTTDYGFMYINYLDHGSVACHPVDETVLLHQSPFRYAQSTKCQPYVKQNWGFTTNELMTHN